MQLWEELRASWQQDDAPDLELCCRLVCVCVCVRMYMYIYIYMYAYVMYVYIYTYTYICVYMYIYICICVYASMHTYMCIYVSHGSRLMASFHKSARLVTSRRRRVLAHLHLFLKKTYLGAHGCSLPVWKIQGFCKLSYSQDAGQVPQKHL